MGCTNNGAQKPASAVAIDQQIKLEQKEGQKAKVLFLGTGESGKSTFLKQIIFLTKEGEVKDDHRLQTKNIGAMKDNVLQGMCAMIKKAQEEDMIPKGKEYTNAIDVVTQAEDIGEREGEALKFLWAQEGIRSVWENQMVHLPPCLDYFLDIVEQVSSPNYVMSADDILRVRHKTTGIQWYDVPPKSGERGWTFVDVGGQQTERRKWMHAFEDVTGVLYLSALDAYDMTLEEDPTVNRMDDDIRLFGELICTPYLPKLWMFFQNKYDIFETKIKKKKLKAYFPDIEESKQDDPQYAAEFIKRKFEAKVDPKLDIKIAWHVTCALDTDKFSKIFKDVRQHILGKAIANLGL